MLNVVLYLFVACLFFFGFLFTRTRSYLMSAGKPIDFAECRLVGLIAMIWPFALLAWLLVGLMSLGEKWENYSNTQWKEFCAWVDSRIMPRIRHRVESIVLYFDKK